MVVIRINEKKKKKKKKKKKNKRGGQLKVGTRIRESPRRDERERERARASARGLKNPRVVASSKHKQKIVLVVSSKTFLLSLFIVAVVLSMMHTM